MGTLPLSPGTEQRSQCQGSKVLLQEGATPLLTQPCTEQRPHVAPSYTKQHLATQCTEQRSHVAPSYTKHTLPLSPALSNVPMSLLPTQSNTLPLSALSNVAMSLLPTQSNTLPLSPALSNVPMSLHMGTLPHVHPTMTWQHLPLCPCEQRSHVAPSYTKQHLATQPCTEQRVSLLPTQSNTLPLSPALSNVVSFLHKVQGPE